MARNRLPMRALTTEGVVMIPNLSDHDASTISRFENAVKQYLNTGDSSVLEQFEGVTIAGHKLETRPRALNWWGQTGELSYESIYGVVQ